MTLTAVSTPPPDASATSKQRLAFRYRLFPLGLITGMFDPARLVELVREGCEGGYRLVRREFTAEPRRVLFFLKAIAFGMMFRRDSSQPEPEHDFRVAIYKTRFFTRTVNTDELSVILNQTAEGGFEMFHAVKYPTRFLFFFPRESYIFLFRRPFTGVHPARRYVVHQTPYRFFSRTMDPETYEADLNRLGAAGQIKKSFRDERRLFGIFRQPTAVTVFERGA